MTESWFPIRAAAALSVAVLLLAGVAAASASAATLEVSLVKNSNNDAAPSSSWTSFIAAQTSRDTSRVLYLSSLASGFGGAPLASGRQLLHTPTYLVRASLGTPPQRLLLAVDTSNDAAWVPCAGCHGCPTTAPSFNPASSATFRPVPCGAPPCSQAPNPSCTSLAKSKNSCGFSLSYGDSSLDATLSQDNLAVTANGGVIKGYTFGCLTKSNGSAAPAQGLLGLGRGPLGFVAQTKGIYEGTFSYCLPSYYRSAANFSGSLTLGRKGQPAPEKMKTTPLLASPHRPSLYYVAMTGVRVGKKSVPIPPSALAFDAATGAGTVLDSGTMFARLAQPAYAAVRDEVRRRVAGSLRRRGGGGASVSVSSLGGFDTCYNVSTVAWPAVTLVFGGGMEVRLPEENVVIRSTYGSTSCLAMAASPVDGVNAALNVIGSLQQQNHRVLFDVPNARVGFARERCTAAFA